MKTDKIALGLAVSALSMSPGQTRDQREIAAYCDCSQQRIAQIEKRALRKMKPRLYEAFGAELESVLAIIYPRERCWARRNA